METQTLIFQVLAYGEPISFIQHYSGFLSVSACEYDLIMLVRSWEVIEFAEIIVERCLNTQGK